MANQRGSIYQHNGTWFLKYRTTESEGGTTQRVHKTVRLCSKNGKSHHQKCPHFSKQIEHRTEKSLSDVRDEIMREVNALQSSPSTSQKQDMRIVDFWEQVYLPYCEREYKGKGMKPSTVRGFKQIWRQHLQTHFAEMTLQGYSPDKARNFLSSLKTKQVKNTLKHIRALASAMFSEAIEMQLRRDVNPWNVKIPKDCKESKRTQHYTLAEAQDIVSALVDHVDCQLIIALSFFLGLRPNEIAALRWEDFDQESVTIRRGIVRGNLDSPKTDESKATLPLIDQVRFPLQLWRTKCENPNEGWVFPSSGILTVDRITDPDMKHFAGGPTPVDLHNLVSRVIIPHINGAERCVPCDCVPKRSSVTWKGLYSGRRGACTFAVEATNGNYAVAQALLRHKSMTTTLNIYKKAISTEAFKEGMLTVQRKALAATSADGPTPKS